MDRSAFRIWFEDVLRLSPGRRLQWPQLFRAVIRDEINQIRERGIPYRGKSVFINRDEDAQKYADRPDQHREDLSVYRLYAEAHRNHQGCLRLGNEPIWLITCKVPNQGGHRHRAADLLGIRADGSLVVFECKVAGNSDTPLLALIEGLDYLGHLMIDKNFYRLESGFTKWRSTHPSPPGFENTELNLNGRHSVIVLAPEAYYGNHVTDAADIEQDWELLSDRHWPSSPCIVRIDFAVSDYSSEPAPLYSLKFLPSSSR